MDAYIISVIVSFARIKYRDKIQGALVGFMPPEDVDRIMTVDLYAISPFGFVDYVDSLPDNCDAEIVQKIRTACFDRKIYISEGIWKYIHGNDEIYDEMKREVTANPKEWVANSPQQMRITSRVSIDDIMQRVPLKYLPHVDNHGTLANHYAYGKYTFKELLEAYITVRRPIYRLPKEYDTPGIIDEIYELLCKAMRLGLLCGGYDRDLTRRLIVDNDDDIFCEVTFDNMDAIDSYIVAHMSEECTVESIDSAPCELIAKAYLLYRKYK